MLNSNEWQDAYGSFLADAQALLFKSEECLSHLELIGEDEDAVLCLLQTLESLCALARQVSVDPIADFTHQITRLLEARGACSGSASALPTDTRLTLKSCLTLISWQLELIDPSTGELPMDRDEQQELLDRLAEVCRLPDTAPDCALK